MNLVIVESKAKCQKIAKDLNSSRALSHLGKFTVIPSFGHIRDLKRKELSIDIQNKFKPIYETPEDKQRTLREILDKVASHSTIWLASDPDLEGEAISQGLIELCRLKDYHRVTFNEINQAALERAFLAPRKIDPHMVDAQLTRRIIDRLVGFELSPLLWKRFAYNKYGALSAGRVQSAALHILIERERTIRSFSPTQYWDFEGKFTFTPALSEEMTGKKGLPLVEHGKEHVRVDSLEAAKQFFSSCNNKWSIGEVSTKEITERPKPPFITSSLQQESHTRFKFNAEKTMKLAQTLYEAGHITYLRTDSTNMSETFQTTLREYIAETYGEEYVSDTIAKKRAAKGAQEAHECIRVTHLEAFECPEGESITADHNKLYKLIWERTVTCAMTATIYDELSIKIVDTSFANTQKHFLTGTKKVKFNGFQIVYGIENESNNFEVLTQTLTSTQVTCEKLQAKGSFTSPTGRFTEATLIKELESNGIGRPSTYATIMSKLHEKNYIANKDVVGTKHDVIHVTATPKVKGWSIKEKASQITIGAEKDKLHPTSIGEEVDAYLETDFTMILDKDFTAKMESDLDGIEHGQKERLSTLQTFWDTFSPLLGKKRAELPLPEEKQQQYADKSIEGTNITYFLSKKGYVLKQGDKVAFLPTETNMETLSKSQAEALFAFPRILGEHEGESVTLHKGQYGLYVSHKGKNATVKYAIEDVSLEMAVALLTSKKERIVREWSTGIGIYNGPYGQYIKSGSNLCNFPQGIDASLLTEKQCRDLLKAGLEAKKGAVKKPYVAYKK